MRSPMPRARLIERKKGLSSWSGAISIQVRSSFCQTVRKPAVRVAPATISANGRGAPAAGGGAPAGAEAAGAAPGAAAAAGAGAVPEGIAEGVGAPAVARRAPPAAVGGEVAAGSAGGPTRQA